MLMLTAEVDAMSDSEQTIKELQCGERDATKITNVCQAHVYTAWGRRVRHAFQTAKMASVHHAFQTVKMASVRAKGLSNSEEGKCASKGHCESLLNTIAANPIGLQRRDTYEQLYLIRSS